MIETAKRIVQQKGRVLVQDDEGGPRLPDWLILETHNCEDFAVPIVDDGVQAYGICLLCGDGVKLIRSSTNSAVRG